MKLAAFDTRPKPTPVVAPTAATVTPPLPCCPWCNTAKHVRLTGFRHFYCGRCGREFDGVDDGDVGYRRPETNAARNERHALNQQRRKTGKAGR